jgi:sugar phosphate isomerase/epimerase
VHSVHAPFSNIGIGHLDKTIANQATRLVCESVEGCAEIGGSFVVVHVSEKHYIPERYEESVKVARELVYQANEVARRVGVNLVLENLVPYHRPHPRYGSSLTELVRDFPEPEIGLCLDTGHAALAGLKQKEEIQSAGSRLLSVHAAGTDGQTDTHQLPTTGIVDWREVEEGLMAIGYPHRLIIEVRSDGDADGVVGRAAELWRKLAGGPYGPHSRVECGM